jgi:hypothetical protein
MTTIDLRDTFSLSQSQFARIFGISTRTVQGWDRKDTLATWQYDLMKDKLWQLWNYYNEIQQSEDFSGTIPDFGKWVISICADTSIFR